MNELQLGKINVIGRQLFPDRAFNWKKKTDWFEITFEILKEHIPKLDEFLEPTSKTPDKYDLILRKFTANELKKLQKTKKAKK